MTKSDSNTAILVVSFGTSNDCARRTAIEACEKNLADAFPFCRIATAISSHHLRKMANEAGVNSAPSLHEALEKLAAEGVQNVLIQPLHIIPGFEYQKIVRCAAEFSQGFKNISISQPLLAEKEDYDETVLAFLPLYRTLQEDECLILMGHGTRHKANECYESLKEAFGQHEMEKVLIATVEGQPEIKDIIPGLKTRGFRKVVLQPFMLVAGEHAHNDMAGDEPDSWKSILTNEGYTVRVEMKGLGELEAIRQIYTRHAKAALETLLHE